jgi:hypothetical protein
MSIDGYIRKEEGNRRNQKQYVHPEKDHRARVFRPITGEEKRHLDIFD